MDSTNVVPLAERLFIEHRLRYPSPIADAAEQAWVAVYQRREVPLDIRTICIEASSSVCDAMIKSGIVKSRKAAVRLILSKAVSLNGTQVSSPFDGTSCGVLKVGKRNFVRLMMK